MPDIGKDQILQAFRSSRPLNMHAQAKNQIRVEGMISLQISETTFHSRNDHICDIRVVRAYRVADQLMLLVNIDPNFWIVCISSDDVRCCTVKSPRLLLGPPNPHQP